MRTSTPTKVLMLGWEFPPYNSGGLGVACLGLAQALGNCNVEISFVLPKKIDVEYDNIRLLFANVPNINFEGIDTSLTPYITSTEYGDRIRSMVGDIYGATLFEETIRYAGLVGEIAQREDFDVIHAHEWLSFLAGIEAKRVSGKPLIVHVHATSYDQSGRGEVDPRVYRIEKKGMEEADIVIAISQYVKDTLIEKYGIDPDKIRIVHNGVLQVSDGEDGMDDSENKILSFKDAGYNIVLFLGRITVQKGPDYFLKAAKRVLEYEPKTIFVMAGSGDMEGQMIRESVELGISDKVFFTGFVRGAERGCLFRSADLFVMPSVSEPFGLVPLEALMEGDTPVLISKQSGVAEVLTHALKVDFWDTEEMANQIIAVLRHSPLREQLRKLGRAEAGGVTWDKAAEKVVDIYKKLISLFKSEVS